MTFRKSILLLISLTMIAALVACSSSSTTTTTPPPVTGPLPDGNYVFSVAGTDDLTAEAQTEYFVAGSIVISGGVITGGEQDFIDFNLGGLNDQITAAGSSITASTDGNLIIVLATADTAIGVSGVETFNGTILPASTVSRTLLTQFDASASGSGELDPQDIAGAGAATPTAGYAFVLGGYDSTDGDNEGCFESVGGIINVDNLVSAGTISGTGSVFDANDCGSGSTFAGLDFANTSVVSAPDANGRVTFTLDTNSEDFPEIILAGYIVDSTHVRLVETVDTYDGTLGGFALSQGANTGTFTAASVAGTYVTGMNGADNGLNSALQAVNQLTLTGGAVTGFVDYNDLINSSLSVSPDPISADYTVDAAGAGDVSIPDLNDDGNTEAGLATGYNLQVYLDGNGNAVAITLDTTDVLSGYGVLQSGAGSFAVSGAYGLDVTGWDVNYDGEFDAVGPVSVASGAITGTADVNWLNSTTGPTFPDQTVTGTIAASSNATAATDGIYSGTITGLDMTTCTTFTADGAGCTSDAFSYYLYDATGDNIAIEVDLNQETLGVLQQQ
jgi:hypothetical protein